MTASPRIALAQLNPTVGAIDENTRKIQDAIQTARDRGADLVVTPELSVTGYPPEDLLLKGGFIDHVEHAIEELADVSQGITAVVGAPRMDKDPHNSAYVLSDGKLVGTYDKAFLPNYSVFDEDRYFTPGTDAVVFQAGDLTFGVSICEDIWYPQGPPAAQAFEGGASLLVNLSASPFHRAKTPKRERMLQTRASDNLAYVAFCNIVGGQDEIVFDGASVVTGPDGSTLARAAVFEEDLILADLDLDVTERARLREPRPRKVLGGSQPSFKTISLPSRSSSATRAGLDPVIRPIPDDLEMIHQALVTGTRDYLSKNRFSEAVIGLSGGIDSALTATLAVDALGPDHVIGVSMPTRYSSDHSRKDAELLAHNLGIRYLSIPVDDIFEAYLQALEPAFDGKSQDTTEENLQARARGTTLMALSNKHGWLVLTTGNKSETSVGYSTLYGDTAGGYALLKDVPKTTVYRLAENINQDAGTERIPESTLTKPPSAELSPDQVDQDTLPPYEVLDGILAAYVEADLPPQAIIDQGFDEDTVRRVIQLVDQNEYKRRQSPPGIRITPRAFGKDRRMPITNRYQP